MTARPIILVLLGCFWPGNDSSGPNQSFIAFASALQDQFDFRVIARDGAPGAEHPAIPDWVDLGYAKARYVPIGRFGAKGLRDIINQTPHDLLWLNSVFDREFTLPALALRRFGLIARKPTLLAPRGEFGTGALGLKSGRKRIFLEAARRLKFWRDVTLHATSEAEARDMDAGARGTAPILIAPNIRLLMPAPPFVPPPTEALRVAFVGRIAPVKQLDYALNVLAKVKSPIDFAIYGPAEDAAYWGRCQELIARLPSHVRVDWRGETPNSGIVEGLGKADVFFLPTAGENFGHAIFEALACGAPALISDQTPWRGLTEVKAGWDLALDKPERFVETLDAFAALSPAERAEFRAGAREKARRWTLESGAVERNITMLRTCLKAGAAA